MYHFTQTTNKCIIANDNNRKIKEDKKRNEYNMNIKCV